MRVAGGSIVYIVYVYYNIINESCIRVQTGRFRCPQGSEGVILPKPQAHKVSVQVDDHDWSEDEPEDVLEVVEGRRQGLQTTLFAEKTFRGTAFHSNVLHHWDPATFSTPVRLILGQRPFSPTRNCFPKMHFVGDPNHARDHIKARLRGSRKGQLPDSRCQDLLPPP